ncbi:MAG TPA: J domain-containing protein, partial [Gemmatimonadales bacterium]
MTLDTMQAYGVLGLAPGATPDEVKTAYRDLVKVWHPDRFPDSERLREKAQRQLQLYNEAYELLRDRAVAAPVPVGTPSPVTPPDGLRRAPR